MPGAVDDPYTDPPRDAEGALARATTGLLLGGLLLLTPLIPLGDPIPGGALLLVAGLAVLGLIAAAVRDPA